MRKSALQIMEKLIVSSSPHVFKRTTTRMIMGDVLIALSPAVVAAIYYFGLRALMLICVTVTAAIASEFFFNLICKKEQSVGDLSAAVTGLLLGLNLSVKVPLWQALIGSVFAIVIVKCAFGGLGKNFANPAITGRVFMLIAFGQVAGGAMTSRVDAVAGATPLEILQSGEGELPSLLDMFLGNRGGAIGETCALALIIGFIYLLIRRVITWHTPVVYVATVFLLSWAIKGDLNYALYSVLGGGLLIGAIFMATDYVTTPKRKIGRMIFALGCGVITVLIRIWGNYPEGVSFAILIMNIITPYIENVGIRRPLGERRSA